MTLPLFLSLGRGAGAMVPVLGAVLVAAPGCLLRAEPPEFIDDGCEDEDLGDLIGPAIVNDHTDTIRYHRYHCIEFGANLPDIIFEWTAPHEGLYEFTIATDAETELYFGVTSPTCDGIIDSCERAPQRVLYRAEMGETVHVVVEKDRVGSGGNFALSITEADSSDNPGSPGSSGSSGSPGSSGSTDCPYQNDGECDEPEGTDLCPEGSDRVDCW